MATIVADIPERFWWVIYDQAHDTNSPVLNPMAQGANCQNFAYELLRHFERHVPYLRSSNPWEDTEHTTIAVEPRALDLLLFNRSRSCWGAHVALHVGDDQAIHLSKKIGAPVVWPLARFREQAEYAVFIGAKRVKSSDHPTRD
jgi:lipoprotein Spr